MSTGLGDNMAKPYRRVQSEDRVVNQIQDNIQDVFNDLTKTQILNNLIIKDIPLTSGVLNVVNHKLGRNPLGYFIIKKNANSVIWDEQSNNSVSDRTVKLRCSTSCIVDILIF